MSKLAWVLCSLAALSVAAPIYPEFLLGPYYQSPEEEILFPFDTVNDPEPVHYEQRVGAVPYTKVAPPFAYRPAAEEDTPVYIAPRDPGFATAYSSLNPLEYVADLQEAAEERRRVAEEAARRAAGAAGGEDGAEER